MKSLLSLAVLAGLVVVQAASAQSVQGKLWVVSPVQAANVAFPAPAARPDATFAAPGIAFLAQGSIPVDYRIGRFLTGDVTKATGLTFSGLPNSNLGGNPASALTPMAGQRFGVIMEFTGTIFLSHGQNMGLVHDDGVSLKIDDQPVSGYSTGTAAPQFESVRFNGTSGVHTIDLLYANAAGVPAQTGAWLLFSPKLF